ncbi:hypothetical protein [Nostoc punctiforme]|nr:hypothetical protein [Nostoc punctiforme]
MMKLNKFTLLFFKSILSEWLFKSFVPSLIIFLTLTLVGIPLKVIASKDNSNNEIETLQIEITQQDLKNIDELVRIAELHSAEIQEAKAGMGLSSFDDVMSIELSTSTSNDSSFTSDRDLSLAITIDPIKIFTVTKQLSVAETRWNEQKRQKRVAVVQSYVDYLQARQASKIAIYQIQQFTSSSRVASLQPQTNSQKIINHIGNPDYVAVVTKMLNTNTRERVALEQLAACIGLSPQATITIINK